MVIANKTFESLLTEHDLARLTRLSLATLRRWRLLGKGPRYAKLGARILYREEDVLAFIEQNLRGGSNAK